jgi:hypothetical protein
LSEAEVEGSVQAMGFFGKVGKGGAFVKAGKVQVWTTKGGIKGTVGKSSKGSKKM